ncbi:MAG: MBL fold metallo-hydrolase [Vulcanimicrobiota bacterium]
MKLSPVLLNLEFQDPVLLVSIPQKARNILFDCGYCFRLKVKDMQKIDSIFISHTHIDHFAGFDHILRLSLDCEKTVKIFGPPGIIKNIAGKLAGYTWNLTEKVFLNFQVTEIYEDRLLTRKFIGKDGFSAETLEYEEDNSFTIEMPVQVTPEYSAYACVLDHKTPVIAYKVAAVPSYNADIQKIKKLGLEPGKWVGELKEKVAELGFEAGGEIEVNGENRPVSELSHEIIVKRTGTSFAFIVDTIFSKTTAKKMIQFCNGVQKLYCECAYLTEERDLARQNYHLTARQAATLAAEAGVQELIPIHFSRRYEGSYEKLYKEAKEKFENVKVAIKYGE